MTVYAVHANDTGQLVSVGTVVASPLPAGLTAVELSTQNAALLASGGGTWDTATRGVIPTPGWIDPAIADANGATIRDRADAALDGNATYLAIATPTNAQVVAQVRSITNQLNGLIRLQLGDLADISDTA
jgi:hypothetical protein